MTPVFRHGRLRLYLLKLLDEAPRHGYEVIRLLQDRFLGVYSPSPGTIYPRLARLEEEGLVTHDEVGGKKVYRITEKGRQELHERMSDLRDLEDDLAASAREIAKEIGRDVRDTVRSLREEIGRAARTRSADYHGAWDQAAQRPRQDWEQSAWGHRRAWDEVADDSRAWDEATSEPGEAGRDHAGPEPAGPGQRHGGPHRDRGPWSWDQNWAESRARRGPDGPGGVPRPGPPRFSGDDTGAWPDLERLAADFARDIQAIASRTRASLDDSSLTDVRGILADAMNRIRTEVFGTNRPADDSKADAEPESRPDS